MVFKRIFRSKPGKGSKTHRTPPGQRIYAVGDIHGRLDLLNMLLEKIDEDETSRSEADTTLIFLGDLVDRGPDSRGVVERLMMLQAERPKTRFLLGNHDEIFLKAASGDTRAVRFLSRIGGRETILSYGVSEEEYQRCDFVELTRVFAEKIPAEHIAFLSSFEDYIEIGDYLFVHAGVKPGVSISDQSVADLRWIRREFLQSKAKHSHMVVHGHSITDKPELLENRIGVDTGAFASGRLTAAAFEETDCWFLTATGSPDLRWQRVTD